MGKKTKRERARERDSFAAQQKTRKRRNLLLTIAILGMAAAIIGYAIYVFVTTASNLPGAPEGSGVLNDEHEHASVLVKIHGDTFDFSASVYQVASNWIHFEVQDGTTIHRHSSGVTLGYLFETLDIGLDDECYTFPNGRAFCTGEDYSLKFFINGESVDGITDYVLEDNDRILISYGGEPQEELDRQLDELEGQPILS